MEKLFEETFAFGENENAIVSRNIWYGYVELYKDSDYGKEILLIEGLIDAICKIVRTDLSENLDHIPTITQWYMYGKTVTQDAIEDTVRPNIMVREKNGAFIIHCNISDNDFAVNIDKVLEFQTNLQNRLVTKTGL